MAPNEKSNDNNSPKLQSPVTSLSLGNMLRPFAVLGVRGLLGVVDMTKTTVQYVREEVEDIVAEAQFERLKKKLDAEIKNSPVNPDEAKDDDPSIKKD